MQAMIQEIIRLVLALVKQTKKSFLYNIDDSSLFDFKPDNKTFQLNFVSGAYVMDLVLLSVEKCF